MLQTSGGEDAEVFLLVAAAERSQAGLAAAVEFLATEVVGELALEGDLANGADGAILACEFCLPLAQLRLLLPQVGDLA